jgi:UDP:flavonoid glycosyltransferase YjiC (YdhE family)
MSNALAVLTPGTRGDIQPLLALAEGLREAGRPATVVAPRAFQALVEQRQVQFAPLAATPNDLLGAPGFERALLLAGDPWRGLWHTARFMRQVRPLFEQMLHSAWLQCHSCRALVLTLPTLAWGMSIAEALGVPAAAALLQPVGRTPSFASPLLPIRRSLGPALNRLTHRIADRMLWAPWRVSIDRWRRGELGLRSLPPGGPLVAAEQARVPALYGFSEQVVARPECWPPWRVITGYWFLGRPPGWRPPEELVRFVERGPPPVYVGFGSMGAARAGLLELVVKALRSLGLRGLLSSGEQLQAQAAGDMLRIVEVWHDWLFPRVAAVVHHGGAGTTAAALRAGVGSLIAPVGVDQFFWAGRVEALGCGAGLGAHGRGDEHALAAALQRVLSAPVRERAGQVAAAIGGEDGVGRAVAELARLGIV